MLSATLRSSHVAAVHHAVRDLVAAAAYFESQLAFARREEGPGFVVLDNGALQVRLVAGNSDVPLVLEIAAPELDRAEQILAAQPDLHAEGLRQAAGDRRVERRFRGPHGLVLALSHYLGEDELDAPLPLPTELPWEAVAVTVTQEVLRGVPEAFRESARRRVVHHAEAATLAQGEVDVSVDQAAASLRAVTPEFQHERMERDLAAALERRACR